MTDAPNPNPVPDRLPSEAYLRQKLVGAGDTVEVQSGAVEAVLAELDRLRRVETAVRNLFEVMPMGARRYLAEHHGDVNRAWLELDLALLPNDEETQDG